MENEIKFYTTADVRRILGIGNKTCLELFHRYDFPCIKFERRIVINKPQMIEWFNKNSGRIIV